MTKSTLQERFLTLIDEHRRILYKISNSYSCNPEDRDDLVQEIVVQLWRSLPVMIWLAAKYRDSFARLPCGRRFMNDITGFNLASAADFIARLARSQVEEPQSEEKAQSWNRKDR